MSLPFRQGLPFRRRGPFRGRGPFANKGPFGRNADYSFWNRRMFWNKAAYDAAPGGRKTLMSVAVMTALGFTSSGGANGTVIGSDGNLAAASAPRITYDRGATSNLLTYSEDLSNAAWSKSAATATASKLVESATTAQHYMTQTQTVVSGQQYTVFARAKAGERTGLWIYGAGFGATVPQCYFDLSAGTFSVQAGSAAWFMVPIGGGVYECGFTAAATSSSTSGIEWHLLGSANATSYAGDGVSGLYFSGIQVNSGAKQPYLRTTSTAPLYAAGTPKAQNLLASTAMESGAWSTNNLTVSAQSGSLPDGSTGTYYRLTATGTGCYVYKLNSNVFKNCTYTNSLWMRRVSGSGTVALRTPANTDVTPTLTGSWQQVVGTSIPNADGIVYFLVFVQTNGDSIDVAWPSSVEGSSPLPYVATTGTPYSLYPQKSLIHEPARTRETLQPRDLTQAAWTKSGSMTAAKTATGIDGVANSASTLTSSGTNQTCLQSVTSASANRLNSARIRSRSASSLTIDMTCDGGTTWQAVTVNAAYMPYMVNQATVTNPIYGFRLRANGDSIDVDFVQGEQYTTLPAVPPMPIWGTESAAQTLSADLIRPPSSYVSAAGPQTTAMRFLPYDDGGGGKIMLGTSGNYVLYTNAGNVKQYDALQSVGKSFTTGVPNIACSRYGGSEQAISVNGSVKDTNTFDGSMGSGGTVGLGDDGAGSLLFWGEFLSLEIATAAATDAQLQAASSGTQA